MSKRSKNYRYTAARRYADRKMNEQPSGPEFSRQQLAVWVAAYKAYLAGYLQGGQDMSDQAV